jgi:hypothetical protein
MAASEQKLIIRTAPAEEIGWRWELCANDRQVVARGVADTEPDARERASKVAQVAELLMSG